MPIRFRCVYCDQLLGIAKRKSGTVVKCPNCAGQVIVPNMDQNGDSSNPDEPTARAELTPAKKVVVEEKTAHAPAGDSLLFERADFDELLKPALERKEPAVGTKSSRSSRPAPAVWAPAPQPPANAFDFAAPAPVPTVAPAPSVAPMTSWTATKPKSGIVLTPLKLILLLLFVFVGMGFAFAGGFILAWLIR